jgi:two-component system, OmpR family, sensor histidine kinase VicK
VNLDDSALQIQEMRKRVALLQSQSEQQQLLEDIELVAAVFHELHLALEELSDAQQALVTQRQRYQELFEEVADAYLVTDPRGLIQEANSAATNLFNISKSFLVGKPLEIYVVEKDQIAFHLKLTELGESSSPGKDAARTETLRDRSQTLKWKTQEWEVSLRPRHKTPIIAGVNVAAIRNQQSKLIGLRWLLRDLSEDKRTEAKLRWAEEAMRQALLQERELNDLKSRLLTTTSDEFRPSLATILASAELLEYYRHQWSDQRQLIHLRRIQKSVMHMTQLLNDVSVLSQAETGRLDFNPISLNLVEFCRNLLKELEHGDNLFLNCLKYSPIGSTVKFSVTTLNNQAIFQIQDFGIGIPAADIEYIFEPFYRAKNAGNIPGVGLGMSIVKKAVYLHGGQITVESSLGAGTTFTVTLPFSGNLHIGARE